MTNHAKMGAEDSAAEEPKPTYRRLSLGRNFAWVFLGDGSLNFARWVLLLVLTKAGTPAVLGLYALARAICAPISFLTGLHSGEHASVRDMRKLIWAGGSGPSCFATNPRSPGTVTATAGRWGTCGRLRRMK